jgi:hypothetical protein
MGFPCCLWKRLDVPVYHTPEIKNAPKLETRGADENKKFV